MHMFVKHTYSAQLIGHYISIFIIIIPVSLICGHHNCDEVYNWSLCSSNTCCSQSLTYYVLGNRSILRLGLMAAFNVVV